MLNQTGIRKESYNNVNQILVAPEHRISVGIVVDDSTYVEEGGKKLVKAGTPMSGKLTERDKVFTVYSSGSGDLVGILEHDVDVTYGEANGTLDIFAVVNIARVDDETKKMLTDDVMGAFKHIIFINEP